MPGLFDSLHRRHPVGGLLVWATESRSATPRGDAPLAAGVVKLLLDGQQRMTSLYGVVRGRVPKFFDGNPQVFTGLRFHLETEVFEFYQLVKMEDDPLWIDVTALMRQGWRARQVRHAACCTSGTHGEDGRLRGANQPVAGGSPTLTCTSRK